MNVDQLLANLGSRIRLLRDGRGWTQEELARRCSRHFTYIGRVERGEQNVTLEVLQDIASAFALPVASLLRTEPHPLLAKWRITADDIVEALDHGFRAQVDVKGKIAELMLYRELNTLLRKSGGTGSVEWIDEDGRPDFVVALQAQTVVVECKNVRSANKSGRSGQPIKVELQKTRNPKDGSDTRGYGTDHFDILSACLFNRTGRWTFLHIAADRLERRPSNPSLLKVMQPVPREPMGWWRKTLSEAMGDLKA